MADTYSVRCDCCGAESDFRTSREADAEVRRIHKAHAGVTLDPPVRGDPDDEVQEAMRRALLYVFQAKQMTPMTALAVIRALAQDGYSVTLDPRPDTTIYFTSEEGLDDVFDWLAARLIAAGVTLDPRPHVADIECAICGEHSVGTFPLCGIHARYGGVDLVPLDSDRWYDVLRPAPDTALTGWVRCRDGGQCGVPRHYHAPEPSDA